MNRVTGFIIFIGVFGLVYFGMNLYPLWRLSTFFGLTKGAWFIAGIIALTLSFIVASALAMRTSNVFTRWFYFAASAWFGTVFLLFIMVAAFEMIRRFVVIDPRIAGFFIIGITVVLAIVSLVNARMVTIKTVEVGIKDLEKPLTVVQLSDIHIGAVNGKEYLSRIVEKTNALSPDLVLITGDLIDSSAPIHPLDYSPLDDIKAPIYFTIGNHEVYEGADKAEEVLKGTKVRVLRNEVVMTDGIQIVGVDDPEQPGTDVDAILTGLGIDKDKPSLLMMHQPSHAKTIESHGIDLHLAGHTHNGQLFPFTIIVKMFFWHIKGLYEYGDLQVYTSPGTGTWGPPMRLGSRNEITNIKLVRR